MRPEVRVEGLKQLRKQLNDMDNELTKKSTKSELSNIMKEAAEPVLQEIEKRVPVRSGALRSSLRTGGGVSSSVVRAGIARIPYAGVINYGTKKTSGRPSNITGQRFMEEGLEAGQEEAFEVVDRELASFIERTM